MSEIEGEEPVCSLVTRCFAVGGISPVREAYLVAREKDVTVSEEALAENVGKRMIFFVEVEDTRVGGAYCGQSAREKNRGM